MAKIATKTKRRAPLFVKEYIESGFNASEAARKVLKVKQSEARQRGYRMLTNDYTQGLLKEALEDEDVDSKWIGRKLKRNAEQKVNLPASNASLDMMIKVRGDYAPEKKANINLNMTNDDILARLNEISERVKELTNGKQGAS